MNLSTEKQDQRDSQLIPMNGFQQILDMLKIADPKFRESLLRRLALKDPKLVQSLRRDLL